MAGTLKSNSLFAIDGLVAVVTGGGSGIGLMIATALAENGASRVYVVGRRRDKLEAAAARYPNIIFTLPGDVTSRDSLQDIAHRVLQETGYINLLVANAGMAGPGLRGLSPRATVTDFVRSAWSPPMGEFDQVYQLNCTATYYTILAFLELLEAGNKRRRSDPASITATNTSQVIAISSMVAFQRDPRYGFAYLSSKAAVVSMIKSFATLGVAWGIRFNTIAPGYGYIVTNQVDTRHWPVFPSDLSAAALAPFKINKDKEMTDEGAFSRSFLPAERSGSSEDIAGVLLYLASRAGAYVNGSVMLVDGGKLATVPATY